jgi:hypothetical protein
MVFACWHGENIRNVRLLTAFFGVTLTIMASGDVPRSFLENPGVRDEKFVLWHDPCAVGNLDLRFGIGGPDLALNHLSPSLTKT